MKRGVVVCGITLMIMLAGTGPGVWAAPGSEAPAAKHPVPREHPRILGSREYLTKLAGERGEAYGRTAQVARNGKADGHSLMMSLSLVYAVENDRGSARQAIDLAMKLANGPIKKGHVPFGADLADCAVVYDLCYDQLTGEERARFIDYYNRTVDANVDSETHVFHNGWYGYKNWGIGVGAYATYYDNPRSPGILQELEKDYRTRAAPALELAGAGGGWAEGYYINYFLYEWLFFCEVARRCDGSDYYALAPDFYRNRAVASMFEAYPGIGIYNSRRPIPMGDSGGRVFGGDRDKTLSARRILVNYFRNDPAHQAVNTFNETTARSSVGNYAYKDFLWRDPSVGKGDLSRFKLSHFSSGPGYVYARSSWEEDSTHFFFKCGDRFTAHQHLDVGNFLIYKDEELAGDGGHYDAFDSTHAVNYYMRTIAHNTMLVMDPGEKWPAGLRAGTVTGNDGGQWHPWAHHNGAFVDVADWLKNRKTSDIGDILAFEDTGAYLYVAGDCTRAYSPAKMTNFTRQIVYLRPGTFVIFDRVTSTDGSFTKTWLLQAMKAPTGSPGNLAVTNGRGRLFVQTVLPRNPKVRLVSGAELYTYGGKAYPPSQDTGPAPECRIEVSPPSPALTDCFLHVLTATAAGTESAPQGTASTTGSEVTLTVGSAKITFTTNAVGGSVTLGGRRTTFPTKAPVSTTP